MTRIGGLLAMTLMAGICVSPLTNAHADAIFDLTTDLKRAANSWALDAPSGAAVLILNTNDRYTLRPDDHAAPADRRWAAQVRQILILARHVGVSFQQPVIAQASLGVWTVRLEGNLSIVASSAPKALAFFLSALTERAPTGDLELITNALLDETSPASQITPGTSEFVSLLPSVISAESPSYGINVSISDISGQALVEATSNVAPGYYQLFFYDNKSRFSPTASTVIKVASTGIDY